jgi:hypothetical protein
MSNNEIFIRYIVVNGWSYASQFLTIDGNGYIAFNEAGLGG